MDNLARELPPVPDRPGTRRRVFADGTVAELVTVQEAKRLLATLAEQRRTQPVNVAKHVRAMRAGEWRPKAKPVMISREGKLIEGKHRLTALVEVGQPQWFVIYRDCDPDEFLDVDDAQSAKTLEDILKVRGAPAGYAKLLASVARMQWRVENGAKALDGSIQPRLREGWRLYVRDKERFDEAAKLARRSEDHAQGISLYAYHLYLGLGVAPDRTRRFADGLATGRMLAKGDAALFLREWLRTLKMRGVKLRHGIMDIAYGHALGAYLANVKATSWAKLGVEWDDETLEAIKGGRSRPRHP